MTELPPHDWHAPIIRAIIEAYARFRKPVYVEIGVDRGHTLNAVAGAAYEVHAVDVTFEHYEGTLPRNANRWEMTSDAFFASYGRAADIIFIDGDHDVAQVGIDIANAMNTIVDDGIIIVHDTFPIKPEWAKSHCGDGGIVIESMARLGDRHAATIPLFPGLSFVTKGINPMMVQ